MRTITLKQRSKFNDKDVLTQILSAPSKEGVGVEFMRFAFKVLDKLEASQGSIVLEEPEYERLRGLIEHFPFLAPHRDFLGLAEDFQAVEEAKVLKLVPRDGVESK